MLGFPSIAANTRDAISLPPGYSASVLISWGQPLHKNAPAFDPSGNGSAKAQEQQFGDNNDGMSLFAFPGDDNRALMAINNELFPAGLPAAKEGGFKPLFDLPSKQDRVAVAKQQPDVSMGQELHRQPADSADRHV